MSDPTESALRTDLAAAFRLVAHFGWDDAVFTHLSVRIPGPEHHFLINPWTLCFDEVTPDALVRIDLEGRAVEPGSPPTNPAGFTIHSAVHSAREDAQCVMHVHTIAGTAVSCQQEGLLPLTQNAMLFGDDVAYHDYEGVALSLDERERLIADLGTKSVLILRNHGLLTVGRTVAEAFTRLYFLQRACEMQIAAQAGGALVRPSEAARVTTCEQGAMGLAKVGERLMWPALLRRLDRRDPGWRGRESSA